MRGSDKRPGALFSYVDLEQRVRPDHPLRAIRALTDSALVALSGDFAALYSGLGRRTPKAAIRPASIELVKPTLKSHS